MQDLRWDDLPLFLAIARAGTLTGAAEALGVNPSTVHRRLGALEAGLGTRLFDRHASGLAPTAAGEALLPLAEQVEADVMALVRAVAGRDQAPRGRVHLTAPETLLPLLVEPLAAFRQAHPAIDLRVSFSDRYFDLARREADIALRPSPAVHFEGRERLPLPEDAVGRRIAAIGWAVYVGRDRDRAPADLPWATYTDELSQLAAESWRRAHHGHDPVLLSVNSIPAMRRVVACSPCRGLLPCFVGDAEPDLRRHGERITEAESALWILVHPDLRRTARVRALADHLWQALRPHRALFEGG